MKSKIALVQSQLPDNIVRNSKSDITKVLTVQPSDKNLNPVPQPLKLLAA
jgi:hypothetical protein